MTETTRTESELIQLMVDVLNLELVPTEVDPSQSLYGDEGFGLDSIDMLELSLAISQRYGVQIRADDADNERIFASLASLAKHIDAHRKTAA